MNWPFFRLNEEHFTCHLPYKHSGTFANHKYEERVSLTPKNKKICNPVLVTLLKMRPHYSHFTRENAAPSSGTSPLASYKEVAPRPPGCHATWAKHTRILVHSIFLHAQREGRVVIFRPQHLHRLSFDTTKFITTSLTSLFAGISDWSLSWPSGSLAIVSRLARKWR